MFAWFEALSVIEQAFFLVALPASLILVIQTILLFFGGGEDSGLNSDTSGLDGGGDFDADFDTDLDMADTGDVDTDFSTGAGIKFLTGRGIITFMTIFGWAGFCGLQMELGIPMSILMATVLGILAMVGVAYLVRALLGLQSNSNINYRDALGMIGNVYLTIPPKGEGYGKITLPLGGRLREYDAVNADSNRIKTGEMARVVDILRDSVMVVERE